MDYEITSIVVTDTKLFNRSGDIGRWAERVNSGFVRHARDLAPSSIASGRPFKSRANALFPAGSMKLSISGGVNRVGPRQLETVVYVNVPYALYVIRGTKSPIFAKSARDAGGHFIRLTSGEGRVGGMYLPGQPGFKSRYRQRVSGQKANPFLELAFERTALTHSSLRGFQMVG